MHEYFYALAARPDCWQAFSLRDDAQLALFRAAPGQPQLVRYDPVMDAARVVIPPTYTDATGAAVTTNSLRNQVRLPLGTEDGHSYLFIWDVLWTSSYRNVGRFNHKAFQFTSGSRDGNAIWLELQTSYGITTRCVGDDFIGSQQWRTYNQANTTADWIESGGNQAGPGTAVAPMGPLTPYCLRPDVWTRFFLRLDQRANDWDRVDAWAADELTDPTPVMSNLLVSVRPDGKTPHSVSQFWLEFNSSTDQVWRTWDLVSYVRNFVAMRDVADVSSLLLRPAAGSVPAWRPGRPGRIRVWGDLVSA